MKLSIPAIKQRIHQELKKHARINHGNFAQRTSAPRKNKGVNGERVHNFSPTTQQGRFDSLPSEFLTPGRTLQLRHQLL